MCFSKDQWDSVEVLHPNSTSKSITAGVFSSGKSGTLFGLFSVECYTSSCTIAWKVTEFMKCIVHCGKLGSLDKQLTALDAASIL